MDMDLDTCVICNQSLENGSQTVKLRVKGCDGINNASRARESDVIAEVGQRVHVKCRREFIDPKRIARDAEKIEQSPPPMRTLRSESPTFNFSEHCLLCGYPAKIQDGKKRGYDIYPVSTHDFQCSIAEACEQRKDEWGKLVAGRLAFTPDLCVVNAVYHQSCSVNFRTMKNIPQLHSSCSSQKHGRPEDLDRVRAFSATMAFLENNDDEQLTLHDLVNKMQEYLDDKENKAYSTKYMQDKIKDNYGDEIFISTVNGKPNVVTFRSKASTILTDFYKEQKRKDSKSESMLIIQTAAKLLRHDIKLIDSCTSSESYPSREQMSDPVKALNYLPETLRELLRILFTGKDTEMKQASVGQAIMQGTRPRVILAPLQFGLSCEMHHKFGSRFIVDTLYKHGFGCSYAEIQRFERSASLHGGDLPQPLSGEFIQFVADNVDHNICTIDGHNTFHGMGIIASVTPGNLSCKLIPRINVTSEDIKQVGKICIRNFESQHTRNFPLTFKELTVMEQTDPTADIDILWDFSLFLRSRRQSWSGMMQTVHQGVYPGKSSVIFLPMIDLEPSNMTCIFSTLTYVCEQANRYHVAPVITFDQPLFWKAMTIIEIEPSWSPLKQIILRLGGLHMEMSFLGCIGHLMAGSGLAPILEVVYAENAVKHILSGKAISRAVRGHLMVFASLSTILIANAYNLPLPTIADAEVDTVEYSAAMHSKELFDNDDNVAGHETIESSLNKSLVKVGELYDDIIKNPYVATRLSSENALHDVKDKLDSEKVVMKDKRTARLWLLYMELVDILRKFIKAERTGDWNMHLQTVREMLPYFAAAGHNLYAKSAYVYLQKMLEIPESHPDIHTSFLNGHHVIHRSDRYWAGLSTDLVIEQVLMRSVKSSGGLTRGRGMTELQRLVWLLSMPACADVCNAMQELSGVNCDSSEQHKDSTQSRIKRDMDDTYKILKILSELNPFGPDPSLRGLVSGLSAHESVNVDDAKDIGESIINSMCGQCVSSISFQRKRQAITLASKTSLKIDDECVQIDPQLLFQRLSLIATNGSKGNPSSYFEYELCTHPPALFDNSSLPWEANKPALADALWKLIQNEDAVLPDSVHYVLDGGALLHRVPWQRGETFANVCQRYVKYCISKYGKATVVFDGYDQGPDIKDVTHKRRTRGSGATVVLTPQTVVTLSKPDFLSNKQNKHRFISILSSSLEQAGCLTIKASGDADVLITQTAILASKSTNTALVGDDTDLLVLLLYHTDMNGCQLFFRPEPKQNAKKPRLWNIKMAKEKLGFCLCSQLLFIHAILGCDSTSRLYGIGKSASLSKIQCCKELSQIAEVFTMSNANKDDVIKAGEKAMLILYNGTSMDSLVALRYKRFREKVAKSSKYVEARDLPPTPASAKFHSLRVYYQIQVWRGDAGDMDPTEWGWKVLNHQMLPVKTDMLAAPDDLLYSFRCSCKTGCESKRCTCRKHGLSCTSACEDCKGLSCSNSITLIEEDDLDN
jgi:hypothetical protein